MTVQVEPSLLEIYFDDLTEVAQKEVLAFLGMSGPKEGNFDVFPLLVLPKPYEDEDKDEDED